MIPEFMGRLPIIVACDELDVDVLVEVLWKPKNALAKQYQRLFEMEGVKLRFTEDALQGVAEEATRRKSGARGLRAILEEVMLDVMYEIPSLTGVSECVVTRDVVVSREPPAARAREEGLVARRARPRQSALDRIETSPQAFSWTVE